MRELDKTDQELLNLLQRGLPLTPEPYRDLGEELGLSAQEVIDRIKTLKEEGMIRRLSGFFHSRKLGYSSLLCAMRVEEEHIEEMASLLEGIPGITHNYLRDHPLNMWFTLLCPGDEEIEKVLALIVESGLTKEVFRFPSKKMYKVFAAFDMREEKS